jgi:hypothetical protein
MEKIQLSTTITSSDKGKPVESLGRNATGLKRLLAMTAGLPELMY